MAEEEPEYFERVVGTVMDVHFWPNIPAEFEAVVNAGPLPEGDPRTESLARAWDSMSRRMTGGTYDGSSLWRMIQTVHADPQLQQVVLGRMNGMSVPLPNGQQNGNRQR